MHPQRNELSIEPYSPALSAAADRITGMRERITTTAGSLREDGTRRTQVGAIAGVVLAAAAAIAAAIALGDFLGSGVAWLFGVVADGAAGFWDQVLYPAAVMPITLYFDLHAPAAGWPQRSRRARVARLRRRVRALCPDLAASRTAEPAEAANEPRRSRRAATGVSAAAAAAPARRPACSAATPDLSGDTDA